jgi:hypothetical protein
VRLQYGQVRQKHFNQHPADYARQNCVGRPHPITFSWGLWDEMQEKGSIPNTSEKQKRLLKESEEIMKVIEQLTIEGRQRKLQLQQQQQKKH